MQRCTFRLCGSALFLSVVDGLRKCNVASLGCVALFFCFLSVVERLTLMLGSNGRVIVVIFEAHQSFSKPITLRWKIGKRGGGQASALRAKGEQTSAARAGRELDRPFCRRSSHKKEGESAHNRRRGPLARSICTESKCIDVVLRSRELRQIT